LRLAIAIGLIVPLALLLIGTRGHKNRVPDVRGLTEAAATTNLQRAGLVVSGVSYEIVTQGSAGTVLRTIPSAGQAVARGSQVHVIASAFAAPEPTPTPPSDPVAAPRVPREPHGKHGGD
jgi:beta-lactam-binding protein with PASTA domain